MSCSSWRSELGDVIAAPPHPGRTVAQLANQQLHKAYRKVVKRADGKYWNVPITSYPNVSQFWTYDPETYKRLHNLDTPDRPARPATSAPIPPLNS